MRDSNINLKLSNVIEYIDEFINRCFSELVLDGNMEEEMSEISVETKQDKINTIEFILDNLRYFKDIFDYTETQMLDICPGLVVENYGVIFNKLTSDIEDDESEMDTIGVGGYNVDFDSLERDFENYYFSPNEIFELKPEWKDGNEGEYFVIEDRDDKVLASPNWETGLSIIPQEVIRKFMIKEIMPYMKQEKQESVVMTPISQIEEFVKEISYFDSECSVDEDGDETILFTTRRHGIVGAEMYGMEDYKAGIKLVDALNLFYVNELKFNLETVDEWIHVWGKRI